MIQIRKTTATRATLLVCCHILVLLAPGAAAQPHWPAWRGPDGTGYATGNPPTTWSETQNVKWKVPLTGTGQSTPVVWGDRIFILAASSSDEGSFATRRPDSTEQPRGIDPPPQPHPKVDIDFDVVCLSRDSGAVLWTRTARSMVPHKGHHPAGSFAPQSAVTDGTLVWAGFGSRGLHCFDMDGNPRWSRNLDPMKMKFNFGEGSSPALAGNTVAVVQDHEEGSKIWAFDKQTGEPRWVKERDEGSAWSTPVAVEVNGSWQIITTATNRIRAYDETTGDIVWECAGLTNNTIPSPLVGNGLVYCSSNFKQFSLKAIALGRTGNLDGTDGSAWSLDKATPYISTPLLYGERLYFVEDIKPLLTCVNAKTGEIVYTGERLNGLRQIFASPVGAGGHIYVPDRGGKVAVIAHADRFEVLAVNELEDGFDASPVVVGDELLLKGNNFLYCIAAK